MTSPEAQKLIDRILKDIRKNGIDTEVLVPEFQKLREFALEAQDPLVTRTLRLIWQHLENNSGFEYSIPANEEEETEGIDDPAEALIYIVELIKHSDNKYNRDEIRQITNDLQGMA